MSYAERNRQIKKLLTEAFGKDKVRVFGDRGTAAGWVNVKIDYTPRSFDERRELRAKVWRLLDAAKIRIGTYGYDHPGSDYGYGHKIMIDFLPIRETEEAV